MPGPKSGYGTIERVLPIQVKKILFGSSAYRLIEIALYMAKELMEQEAIG